MKANYTVPKIIFYHDLDTPWYVYFRYENILVRKKYGLNYIKNFQDRMLEAETIKEVLHQKLKSGWNPFLKDIYNYSTKLSVIEALEFALKNKTPNISDRTFKDYRISLNHFNVSIKK
ncbi:MAG: hypothetical protein H7174_06950, partial [Flavobacterium sp.]|nr:hypothetical protein [Flavobacterium sp.]